MNTGIQYVINSDLQKAKDFTTKLLITPNEELTELLGQVLSTRWNIKMKYHCGIDDFKGHGSVDELVEFNKEASEINEQLQCFTNAIGFKIKRVITVDMKDWIGNIANKIDVFVNDKFQEGIEIPNSKIGAMFGSALIADIDEGNIPTISIKEHLEKKG